jgi:hypothetical protein
VSFNSSPPDWNLGLKRSYFHDFRHNYDMNGSFGQLYEDVDVSYSRNERKKADLKVEKMSVPCQTRKRISGEAKDILLTAFRYHHTQLTQTFLTNWNPLPCFLIVAITTLSQTRGNNLQRKPTSHPVRSKFGFKMPGRRIRSQGRMAIQKWRLKTKYDYIGSVVNLGL